MDKIKILVLGSKEPLSLLDKFGISGIEIIRDPPELIFEREDPPELIFEPEKPKNRAQRRHPEK